MEWDGDRYAEAPALDAQGASIRAEFAAGTSGTPRAGAADSREP
jgi:hypothetical protein